MPSVKIKGMSCPSCVRTVTEALKSIDGITRVANVDLIANVAEYEEDKPVDMQTIVNVIRDHGYEVVTDE